MDAKNPEPWNSSNLQGLPIRKSEGQLQIGTVCIWIICHYRCRLLCVHKITETNICRRYRKEKAFLMGTSKLSEHVKQLDMYGNYSFWLITKQTLAICNWADLSSDACFDTFAHLHYAGKHQTIRRCTFWDHPLDVTNMDCGHLGFQTNFLAHRLQNFDLESPCIGSSQCNRFLRHKWPRVHSTILQNDVGCWLYGYHRTLWLPGSSWTVQLVS